MENILEKGEVEATKENEKDKKKVESKEKDKDEKDNSTADNDKDKDKSSVDNTSNGSDNEVVFIQDMGFTVKIVSPGAESFDIQVSSMELVQVI